MRSLLWIAAALAATVTLGVSDASAFGRRGGRGGCGCGGYESGCGGCGYGYSGCGYGGCGSGGCGYGYSGCGSGGCGYSGCGSSGYGHGCCASAYDGTSTTAVAEADRDSATLVVKVPAGARLYIDDQPTTSTSKVRVLETPRMPVGGDYQYTLRAEVKRHGETQTVTKVVHFRAGEERHVTLSLPAESVAAR